MSDKPTIDLKGILDELLFQHFASDGESNDMDAAERRAGSIGNAVLQLLQYFIGKEEKEKPANTKKVITNCVLCAVRSEDADCSDIAWIPEESAIIGKYVRRDDKDGIWLIFETSPSEDCIKNVISKAGPS